MNQINIATFNVKDKGPFFLENKKDNERRAEALAKYILMKNFDALCMQEATKRYIKHLMANLPDEYKAVGDFRQKLNPFFNEANSILTHRSILETDTIYLPHMPNEIVQLKNLLDIHKRTATYAIINIPGIGNICIINTHLTYLRENPNQNVKLERFNNNMSVVIDKQFEAILNLQRDIRALKPNLPIITMGDFNATVFCKRFETYMRAAEELGMIIVPNEEKTQKGNDHPIDHIFYTSDLLGLEEYGVSTLQGISDHRVVEAKFLRR